MALLSCFCIALAALSSLFAGGPLIINGDGVILIWDASVPVAYRIDPGSLGVLTHEAGAQLVREAFGRWDAVETSSITSLDAGLLNVDVDSTNFTGFFNAPQPESSIIFDADGQIIEQVAGVGSSNSVLGFAAPQFSSGGFVTYGIAVLNGKLAGRFGFSQTVTHELGHLLSLDHTQINSFLGSVTPLMFPIALNGQSPEPLRDDQAWISWLYPDPSFATTTGTISGRIRRRSGHYAFGTNVVAVKLEPDGEGGFVESAEERVSAVSDYLMASNGAFNLPGLTPGDYAVFTEPLNTLFTQGSGVGPYDVRPSIFAKDYFNGAAESGDPALDNPAEMTALTVGAGQSVDFIEIFTNNILPEDRSDGLTNLGDDDSTLFEFPTGFAFPFAGRVVHFAHVNSDGNLTFLLPDGDTGPRTDDRLLSGIPRIAPLLSDMDPTAGGEIRALHQPGQLTFLWDAVPEFAQGFPPPPGNTFSVTLFSTGDIQFHYQDIQITPDGPPSPMAFGTVGVSPGFFSLAPNGPETDLSTEQQPIPLGNSSIFEEFLGAGFDLSGQTITFAAPKTELYFPFYRGDLNFFTGFAATDFSAVDAALTLESRQADGTLSTFGGSLNVTNPSVETLNSQGQFARVGSELFGVQFNTVQDGWVRLTSSVADLASFFQFGNGLSGPITLLDGGVALEQQSSVLYFTRVYQGPVFPTQTGFLDAQTTLSIANPNQVEIQVDLNYVLPTGQDALATISRTIAAQGVLRDTVASLFNTSDPFSDGHIRVTVTQGPGAVGFELIELPDAIFGLNALSAGDSATVYSAQLAQGGANSSFTDLKLVNTSGDLLVVTITAVNETGQVIGQQPNLPLNPNQSFQRSLGQLFGIPAEGPFVIGSIIVEAGEPGVIGDVIFGDPVSAKNAAALALQSDLFRSAVFSQVSNGATNPADPSTDAFTGIALFNPGDTAAQVTIQVFTPQGALVGEATIDLEGGFRVSDLVENFVPSSSSQIGGYIRLTSTADIVAQLLLGNNLLSFLSAVPPRIEE